MTFTELLVKYHEMLDSQPTEVKELISIQENYMGDENIQTLLDYLASTEDQYSVYTHS